MASGGKQIKIFQNFQNRDLKYCHSYNFGFYKIFLSLHHWPSKRVKPKWATPAPPSSRHFFNPPPIGLKFIKNHLKKVDKWSSWYISDVTKSSQNLQFFSQRVCNEPMFAPKKNLTYVLYVFICISYRNLCFQCFMSVFIWSIATKVNEAGVRYILILLYFSLSTLFLNEEHDTIVIQSGSR